MKVKYLVIVSLILAILTIGAVSASEDVSDDLAVDEGADIEQAPVDEEIVASEDTDVIADKGDDIDFYINDEDVIIWGSDDDEDWVVSLENNGEEDVTGNLDLAADGKSFYNKNIAIGAGYEFNLWADDLPDLPVGTYLLTVTFTPTGEDGVYAEGTIEVDSNLIVREEYKGELNAIAYDDEDEEYYVEAYGDEDVKIRVDVPKSVTGVTYTFNGATKNVALTNGVGFFTLPSTTLDLKYYDVVVRSADKEFAFTLYVLPDVSYFNCVASNQDYYLDVLLPKVYSGTAEVYTYNPNTDTPGTSVIARGAVSNGKASILMPKLQRGEYYYIVKFISTTRPFNDFINPVRIEVIDNNPNVKTTVTPLEVTVGTPITVSGSSNSAEYFSVFVDGVFQKEFGPAVSFSHVLSNLAVGQHKINVLHGYEDGGDLVIDYNQLYYVTVKAKPAPAPAKEVVSLALKKVKSIKKSAKKLVLQATLKVNGKAKSGAKITFKLNKKTFTAKTNKKGVAKVTIKKKVLKKLKGKKATIQASYGKTVKKMTVKIKK